MYPNNSGGFVNQQGWSNTAGQGNDYQPEQPFGYGFNQQIGNANNYGGQGYLNQGYQNQGFSGSKQFNTTFCGMTIPDEFQMTQKMLTLGMDMFLQKDGVQFGFMNEKLLSLGSTFELQTNDGKVIATAK